MPQGGKHPHHMRASVGSELGQGSVAGLLGPAELSRGRLTVGVGAHDTGVLSPEL